MDFRRVAGCLMISMLAGCTAGPGDSADEDSTYDPAAPNSEGGRNSRGAGATDSDVAAQGTGLRQTWYLDYNRDCLSRVGSLVLDRPSDGACWHLPGPIGTRSFEGSTGSAWSAHATVSGSLRVVPQTPTLVDLEIRFLAGGELVGAFPIEGVLVLDAQTFAWSMDLPRKIPAGSDLALEIVYAAPTVTDYIMVGPSALMLME